jgi:hypothetical protein
MTDENCNSTRLKINFEEQPGFLQRTFRYRFCNFLTFFRNRLMGSSDGREPHDHKRRLFGYMVMLFYAARTGTLFRDDYSLRTTLGLTVKPLFGSHHPQRAVVRVWRNVGRAVRFVDTTIRLS